LKTSEVTDKHSKYDTSLLYLSSAQQSWVVHYTRDCFLVDFIYLEKCYKPVLP